MKPPALADLVRAFAGLYVRKPTSVEVKYQVANDGAVYFAMKGHREDDSRLVGKDGSHADSLEHLIARVGQRVGKIYTFRLVTDPERYESASPRKDVLEYDPDPACAVLWCWVNALTGGAELQVKVGPGSGPRDMLSFDFEIKIEDRTVAEAMTKPSGPNAISEIAALGTLMRAVARKAGVRFQVRLADRKEK